jgi:glutamate/tyrosine decarboxylase-like PLP-dependent enzyme
MVTGTAGTVDVGATDDLLALAALCRKEKMWFHVDGAFGALGMLSPTLRPLLAGIESADSIAFDFHKWGQVPYDAGCILVRDRAALLRAFSTEASYLRADSRGLAAGAPWPCDMGPDLSRGFRALKVWFTIKALGADRLGASIDRTCAVARHLAARVDRERELERVAPVALNIVCFRFRFDEESDRKNAEIVADVQERGVGVPSTTRIDGRVAVRCAIVNHRTRPADVDALVDAILAAGRERAGAARAP